jgi:hypothetical protein
MKGPDIWVSMSGLAIVWLAVKLELFWVAVARPVPVIVTFAMTVAVEVPGAYCTVIVQLPDAQAVGAVGSSLETPGPQKAPMMATLPLKLMSVTAQLNEGHDVTNH